MAFNLDNYISVAERLQQAAAAISSIIADRPTLLTDTYGFIRVKVSLNDGREASGTASFDLALEGRSAQATNPIEDAETSALGRALAFLGYASTRSIASREEMQEAQRRANRRPTR